MPMCMYLSKVSSVLRYTSLLLGLNSLVIPLSWDWWFSPNISSFFLGSTVILGF